MCGDIIDDQFAVKITVNTTDIHQAQALDSLWKIGFRFLVDFLEGNTAENPLGG